MKNALKTIIAVYLTISMSMVVAQPNEMTYKAYLTTSQVLWEESIKSSDNEFEKALAMYGYLNATMANQDENAFDKYYDDTVDLLEYLSDHPEYSARAKALLSSVYGFSIAFDGWKGMFLGSKSSSLVADAYKANSSDPLVVKLYAGNKYYTPETYGGDPKVALENGELAVALFEANGDTVNNWLYVDALANLGMMQRKNGDITSAVETFKKALVIEPDFAWVKFSLLPSAQKLAESK